ncbi:MAG: hypothetical protein M0006_09560 [Magnetospirillum sp.]|nr:hypothetical protein [Magnetospirillum sp.]
MPSDVDICNLALLRLGTRSSIASLAEGSTEANACALLYPVVRDTLLTLHPWRFASRRTALADLGTPPEPWRFRYAYPADCLRAQSILQPLQGGPAIRFVVAGDLDSSGNPIRVILADQPQAELVYTGRIAVPTLFNAMFVEALSWMMAAELAVGLTGDKTLAQTCQEAAGAAVASARAEDGNESADIHHVLPESLEVRGYPHCERGPSWRNP